MKKIIAILILISSLAVLSFFILRQSRTNGLENGKLQITTSFYPMFFFTSQIGGDKVNVVNITPAGSEPHDYEPTPQDIIAIEQSKLLVLNGNIEPWGNKIKEELKNKNTEVIIAGENSASTDPHVWLSPALAKIESEKIKSALENIDPANADYYQFNLTNLEKKLDKIDKDYKIGLANCNKNSFVTTHAAFGYISKNYGLTQVAITGLTPDEEPSLQKIAQIANFAKENNIKYIFFEALTSPKLSQTIANEMGAKTLVLDPIEGVSSQDLSKGVNYLTLMDNNLQNLRIALECK